MNLNDGTETPAAWYPDPTLTHKLRYWDGTAWTDHFSNNEFAPKTPDLSVPLTERTPEERKAILAQTVGQMVARSGYRLESQSDYQAILVHGKRVNHILHLILTIITLGLWLIVWLILGLAGGEKRKVVSVDDYGQVLVA